MTQNAPPTETQVQYHRRRADELKKLRQPWESVWGPLGEFIEPTRLRLNNTEEGAMSRAKIIDSRGTFALRTLASGMHSGITSPARPWFRLTTFDPDLKDYDPVKNYLATCEQRMREVFQSSNIYSAMHTGYGDLGQFGQSVSILIEDENETIRMQQLLHGRFWISRNEFGRVDTLYRTFRWSVAKIVKRFGYNKCSLPIRNNWDRGQYDTIYDIWHAIEPRMERNPNSKAKWDMRFLSNYWEEGSNITDILEESGFPENPIIAPGWEIAGEDTYALSPGMIALPDIKMLQVEQTRKLEAIDKMVRPPMVGPTSMRNNPASLLPGSITYVDTVQGGQSYRSAMDVNLRISELAQDIRETGDRIDRAFYADLFLMLAQMEGIQPRNQFEIAERKEEKLLALGPVLENIYNGQLEPIIDRTFAIMNRNEMLPPPPPELEGQELKIEYISILAQAQKAVATGAIERGFAFAAQVSAVKPEVLDKLDGDTAIERYFDYLGVPPDVLYPDDKVENDRKARQEEMAQAKNAEMAATMAPAAKQGAEAASVLAGAMGNPSAGSLLQQIGLQ